MAVLVTGGAGYIGSHTCVELLENNKEVVVLDNLSNSSEEALNRVKRITGKEVKFYKGDISDIVILDTIFKKENIESCIHFAGLKSVGESVAKPLEYYQNNIAGTLILLQKLREYNVKNIIFSSSATVYGDPAFVPITEECPKGLCTNPYGWSKSMLEQILMDIYKADETWNIILLRYFNPIGAHKSGLMGENPNGIPNNLMPYVTQVAVGKLKELGVFGNRGKASVRFPPPVLADGRHAVRGAIRACPDHVRPAEAGKDVLRRHGQHVRVKVDVVKPLVPFHTENLMPVGFKGFPNASRSGEQFQYLHSSCPFP